MKNFLNNWNIMKVIRLVLGIFIIIQGVIEQQWLLVGLGGLFSLMSLMNIGCCSVSGCNTPIIKSNKKSGKIEYEEVH